MHVVVCTVVHHPADARIFYREIQALLDAGHDVTYIAPHDEQPERARASTGPAPLSPGLVAAGHLREISVPITPVAMGTPDVASSRIVIAAVCQPLAARPSKNVPRACSSSRWKS